MISDMVQCEFWILWPTSFAALGGLIMALGSLKEKPGTYKTTLTLIGGIFVAVGFLSVAYLDIKRYCGEDGIAHFWLVVTISVVIGGILLVFFFLEKRVGHPLVPSLGPWLKRLRGSFGRRRSGGDDSMEKGA
jgi:hypothetical protein